MMWKLLVYVHVANSDENSRCYVFEFNTETSAKNAAKFFDRGDCHCQIISDAK